jgi:hypothetical protein
LGYGAGWCNSFHNAKAEDLVKFLTDVVPNESNSACVTWAISRLGVERYKPGTSALVKLLDFRRPLTSAEKLGFWDRPRTIEELFPAAEALEEIGTSALPDVIHLIEDDSSSTISRENALAVWMENFKYDRPTGIARLKQKELTAGNEAIRKHFGWAAQAALKYCATGPEEAACKQAASTGLAPVVESPAHE